MIGEASSHLIFLADQCWAFGCTRPAYVALVEEKGHTFRCRQVRCGAVRRKVDRRGGTTARPDTDAGARRVNAPLSARWDAWSYNMRNRIAGIVVRFFRLLPYCPCGWPLARRQDDLWICGACANRARAGRPPWDIPDL